MTTSATTDVKIQLLSGGIPPRIDGEYSYHEKSLLLPHETLRREMNYGLKALSGYDPIRYGWKAYYFETWLREFLAPSIHGHHDLEEHCFFRYYEKLGAEVPPKQCQDHKTLMALLTQLCDHARLISHLVYTGASPEKLTPYVEQLRPLYVKFLTEMDAHLNEEEAFWPAQVERFGEKEFMKCEQKVVQYARKHEGPNGEVLLMAVLYAAGLEIGNVSRYPDDTYWLGPLGREQFLKNFPYPVRVWLLPGWNKRYQRYKKMIHAISGQEDVLHLGYDSLQPGCSCIIS